MAKPDSGHDQEPRWDEDETQPPAGPIVSTAPQRENPQTDSTQPEDGQQQDRTTEDGQSQAQPEPEIVGREKRSGSVVGDAAGGDSPPAREKPAYDAIMRRLMRECDWRAVCLVRDQMMRDAKKALPDIDARREWVYGELDRMYPPFEKPIRIGSSDPGETDTYRKLAPAGPVEPASDGGAIRGLSDIPPEWLPLPANASMATEIGWVQANRLLIVEERPGKATLVRLRGAISPAPSYAALGWLETSIRNYAKFVDVAAKVSGGGEEDEGAVMRRERKSIDEVRRLLAEMEADRDDRADGPGN